MITTNFKKDVFMRSGDTGKLEVMLYFVPANPEEPRVLINLTDGSDKVVLTVAKDSPTRDVVIHKEVNTFPEGYPVFEFVKEDTIDLSQETYTYDVRVIRDNGLHIDTVIPSNPENRTKWTITKGETVL